MSFSLNQLTGWLDSAGSKYNVPPALLLGVLGRETSFGNNVTTSSTGAMGLMQFEPATARSYGYPMTNSPTAAQAQQQLDSAAHFLSDLYHQTGNWNTALEHYSGGGYGLPQVQSTAQSAMGASGAATFFGGGSNLGGNAQNNPWGPGAAVSNLANGNVPVLTPAAQLAQKASGLPGTFTNIFNTAVSDIKTGAVTLALVLLGAMLIYRAFRGGDTAGHSRTVIVPA